MEEGFQGLKRVTLISYHSFNSSRKAGFHWLAEAFSELGMKVIFVTSAISCLSYFKNDFRLRHIGKRDFNKFKQESENIKSYVFFTGWHPVNFNNDFINKIFSPLFRSYGNFSFGDDLLNEISDSSIFIFESFSGLFHFPKLKKLNQNAKFVYRVSDDMKLINLHPEIINYEQKIYPEFDLISVPIEVMKQSYQNSNNVKIHKHGIRKQLFDDIHSSPYTRAGKNFVFTGISLLDFEFLKIASKKFPEFNFHIIGPFKDVLKSENVKFYGEMPFIGTIPFIKFADAGLLIRTEIENIETLSESLKSIQYTYCRLPVIAPHYLKTNKNNYFYYNLNNPETIKTAIEEALNYDRNKTDISDIKSWQDIANMMADEL